MEMDSWASAWVNGSSEGEVKRDAILLLCVLFKVAECNIFPLLDLFCVQTGNVSHIFAWKVVSIQYTAHSPPRAHAAAAPRKVTSALPSLAPRWAGGRGAEAPLIDDRKYWLQYMRKTGNNVVKLEDKLDCGRLGGVTTCCCRDNLKMLINDKKVINQRTAGPPF